jgi:hypothetical protein
LHVVQVSMCSTTFRSKSGSCDRSNTV